MMFRFSARADSYVRIGSLSPDLCHSTFTSNPVHWKHSPYFLQELIRLLVVAPSDVRCELTDGALLAFNSANIHRQAEAVEPNKDEEKHPRATLKRFTA